MERSQLKKLSITMGRTEPALTLNEEVKSAVTSSEAQTEWIIFCTLLAKKSDDSIALQVKELSTNKMLVVTIFPNLHTLASICLTITVSTASFERSNSQIKQIKTWLRNSLTEGRFSQLMEIIIEFPEKLKEVIFLAILNV